MSSKSPAKAKPDTPGVATAWQLSLPCSRAEGQTLEAEDAALFGLGDSAPAIMISEPDPARPDCWQLDIIFDHEPGATQIDALLARIPSADRSALSIAPVPDVDWVTQSQEGLEPIAAGRFHVRHREEEPARPDAIDFLVPASRAFGTGSHETTRGCLIMLDQLRERGHRFGNVADIGTGTGLLAFAALALWPSAHALASDIDPVSIDVTAENAVLNKVKLGAGPGELLLVAAPGVDHSLIEGLAPYDLIIANILAGPLIELAPSLSAQLAEGGSLVLAGLLQTQADQIIAAYRAQGLRLAERVDHGDWPTLHLRKRHRFGWRRPVRWRAGEDGATEGFGSW